MPTIRVRAPALAPGGFLIPLALSDCAFRLLLVALFSAALITVREEGWVMGTFAFLA